MRGAAGDPRRCSELHAFCISSVLKGKSRCVEGWALRCGTRVRECWGGGVASSGLSRGVVYSLITELAYSSVTWRLCTAETDIQDTVLTLITSDRCQNRTVLSVE